MADYNIPLNEDSIYEKIRSDIRIGAACYMCGAVISGVPSNGRKLCIDCSYDWRDSNGIPENKA